MLRSSTSGPSFRFDTFASASEARACEGEAYERILVVRGAWSAAPTHAAFAEWQVGDPERSHEFEESRRRLFDLRRENLPRFAVDWLLKSLDREGRYLVLGLYGDEESAARLCRLHLAIQLYIRAHPPSEYGAIDLTGLCVFRVESASLPD